MNEDKTNEQQSSAMDGSREKQPEEELEEDSGWEEKATFGKHGWDIA